IQAGAYQPERLMAEIQGLAVQVVDLVKRAGGATPATAAGATSTTAKTTRTRRSTKAAAADEAAVPDSEHLPAFGGKCPRCGRAVVKGSRDWKCASADCTLRIPTWLCGKVIDSTHVASLLEKGRTKVIEGFKSPRTGKTFSAFLVLKDGAVSFEFPPDRPKKASGYRRNAAGGTAREPEAAKKSGSRKAGSRTAAASGRTRSTGVGGRSPGTSQPAGTGARRD
ncbi:MAG TPA: topoisomerase C-terminal repeat-containing protein, partial [Symbiobacteriaceae bacterium]|nr:topoisomerase C-terminal repeat-containing protein [Symbiobacteriaceae bacterium]